MAKTYNDLYIETRRQLKEAGISAYALEARLIVAHAAGKTSEKLLRDMRLYTNDEMGAKVKELIRRRLLHIRIFLGCEEHLLVAHHGLLHRPHGFLAAHIKMYGHSRKNRQAPQGHDRHNYVLLFHSVSSSCVHPQTGIRRISGFFQSYAKWEPRSHFT